MPRSPLDAAPMGIVATGVSRWRSATEPDDVMKTKIYAFLSSLTAILLLTGGPISVLAAPSMVPGPSPAPAEEGKPTPAPSPSPTPTPQPRVVECEVETAGERCSILLHESEKFERMLEESPEGGKRFERVVVHPGVVAYRDEGTGDWIEFASGPFDDQNRPHGCGWVLRSPERLVEELGCFEHGKRHGIWKTCRVYLDQQQAAMVGERICPENDYEMGRLVVKPEEPEPEPEEEAPESAPEGEDSDATQEAAEGGDD